MKMTLTRRRALAGLGGLLAAPAFAQNTQEKPPILVVVELSGGNDGLNTIVPHGDDRYYGLRPTIGIRRDALLPLDDYYGFNPGLLGLQRLWQTDDLAIVHNVGYDQPSYSHFTSMAYWHTGVPNGGAEHGWLGRVADTLDPTGQPNFLVNIGPSQSLAVKSRLHAPIVFDDPGRFERKAFASTRATLAEMHASSASAGNASRDYLNHVAQSARDGSRLVRAAWSRYRSQVDYGIAPMDLPKVAACIDAGFPASLYHVSFRNNGFDTHVEQPALHRRLLSYAADGIHGFIRDLERLGHADRVVVMAFSEFGRRVPENSNRGTDHGAAGLMFFAGKPVRGGHYGERANLDDLLEGDNLKPLIDFRRVYATAIDGWLRPGISQTVLGDAFQPLDVFT